MAYNFNVVDHSDEWWDKYHDLEQLLGSLLLDKVEWLLNHRDDPYKDEDLDDDTGFVDDEDDDFDDYYDDDELETGFANSPVVSRKVVSRNIHDDDDRSGPTGFASSW